MQTAQEKSAYRNWGGYAAGVVVIAVGLLFLLDNFGYHPAFLGYNNWWALFILMGAVGPLGYAIQRYRNRGRIDGAVLHSLVSVASIVTVALMFLLNLDWALWWPVFVIFGGLWMLANNWRRESQGQNTPE